ncbi:MAG: HRDC domain-containing protein [Chloroflexi bacterium]|nr:HRDC domain-containing protein [Chloroflexota bacterium]
MTDQALVAIARAMPKTLGEMRRISGVAHSYVERYGEPLLAAIHASDGSPPPAPPIVEPPADPQVVERYTALREWRKGKPPSARSRPTSSSPRMRSGRWPSRCPQLW